MNNTEEFNELVTKYNLLKSQPVLEIDETQYQVTLVKDLALSGLYTASEQIQSIQAKKDSLSVIHNKSARRMEAWKSLYGQCVYLVEKETAYTLVNDAKVMTFKNAGLQGAYTATTLVEVTDLLRSLKAELDQATGDYNSIRNIFDNLRSENDNVAVQLQVVKYMLEVRDLPIRDTPNSRYLK